MGRVCLALPGVTLDHPFGDDHDTYKVGGMGGVSFKVSDIAYEVLTDGGRARPAPYLARAPWVHREDPADWPDDDLAEHLAIAHGIVAAKMTTKARVSLGLT